MYGPLAEPVANLQPDQALFVTTPTIESSDDAGDAVHTLARGLKNALRQPSLVFLPDRDLKGVWVYLPVLSVGISRAIGPVKEAEVKSRPLDP